jgi:3-hydroxyisobutyrate dehydrogenase-like beta-hydroxyacid dehydrogenase
MASVGFVGRGIMGRPRLRNLLKAGHTVIATFVESASQVEVKAPTE